jgi:hypothetical protein
MEETGDRDPRLTNILSGPGGWCPETEVRTIGGKRRTNF